MILILPLDPTCFLSKSSTWRHILSSCLPENTLLLPAPPSIRTYLREVKLHLGILIKHRYDILYACQPLTAPDLFRFYCLILLRSPLASKYYFSYHCTSSFSRIAARGQTNPLHTLFRKGKDARFARQRLTRMALFRFHAIKVLLYAKLCLTQL